MQKYVYVVTKGELNENPETVVKVFMHKKIAEIYCNRKNAEGKKDYGIYIVEMDWTT